MRRLLFTVLACVALTVALPASAMARHHSRNHSSHRLSHTSRSHRVRIRHFGAADSQPGTTAGTQSGDDNGQGDDNDQGEDNNQTAGTVTSFSGGMLTITLNDGSTVTGQVTGDTNIECEAAATTQMQNDDHGDGGGDNSGSGDDNGGDGNDQGDQGEDNGASCTPAPGMVVREAELRVSSAGAIWHDVELIS